MLVAAAALAQEAQMPPPAPLGTAMTPGAPMPPAADGTLPLGMDPTGPMPLDAGLLPHDLSPLGMFLAADIVVQSVMVGLLFASLVTWTVCLAKWLELRIARNRVRALLPGLAQARSLIEAGRQTASAKPGPVPAFVEAAGLEIELSADAMDKDGVKERVVSRLERIEAAAGRRMTVGTGVLATIGSTAPFVGLFGTVWGIMNSFIGISQAQTTNLAVVAPGIAEALLATAMGLVAAIPAVVVYNHFARQIAGYRAMLGDASAAVLRLVSRDFDRNRRAYPKAAE
ncbi:MAG: tonB-system energizer ExbB [Alphaproteobacteria bacterium]